MTDPRNLLSVLDLESPTHYRKIMTLSDLERSQKLVISEDLLPKESPGEMLQGFRDELGMVPFAIEVMLTRMEHEAPSIKLSRALIVWVVMQMKSCTDESGNEPGPGEGVLWAHGIVRAWLAQGSPDAGVRLAEVILAVRNGPPTSAGIRYLWRQQKRPLEHMREHPGGDNWLDYSRAPWRELPEGYEARTAENFEAPEPTPGCDCLGCSLLREAMAAQGDQPEVAPTRH